MLRSIYIGMQKCCETKMLKYVNVKTHKVMYKNVEIHNFRY